MTPAKSSPALPSSWSSRPRPSGTTKSVPRRQTSRSLQSPKNGSTECVEATDYMRANHMDLLDQWRDTVVRDDVRTYTSKAGKSYTMSLSDTCLDCHSNKDQFCDACHTYSAVTPYCWDCHVIPEEGQ